MKSDNTSALSMIGALAGVATLAGLLVVTVFQLTQPIIASKKAAALRKAIYDVVPDAHNIVSFFLDEKGDLQVLDSEDKQTPLLYGVYAEQGGLSGIAVEASGQGYQETIKVIYGYNLDRERIVGMKVLESKETPGLGDKIEKDPAFARNFESLDVALNKDRSGLQQAVKTVKQGEKQKPWQIDGITGATISSKAIGRIINQSANFQLPIIARNEVQIRKGVFSDVN
jgi:electron transport complex protein RnfG